MWSKLFIIIIICIAYIIKNYYQFIHEIYYVLFELLTYRFCGSHFLLFENNLK